MGMMVPDVWPPVNARQKACWLRAAGEATRYSALTPRNAIGHATPVPWSGQ